MGQHRKYSTFQLKHKAWMLEKEIGRELVASDMNTHECVPSLKAYTMRFGSWNSFKDKLEKYKRDELQVKEAK